MMGEPFDVDARLRARNRQIEEVSRELQDVLAQLEAAKAKDLPGIAARARLLARYVETAPASSDIRAIVECLADDLEELAFGGERSPP